jgi:hypothetical protein
MLGDCAGCMDCRTIGSAIVASGLRYDAVRERLRTLRPAALAALESAGSTAEFGR